MFSGLDLDFDHSSTEFRIVRSPLCQSLYISTHGFDSTSSKSREPKTKRTNDDMIDHRSYAHNLSSCEIKDKKSRPERDSNPCPLWHRFSALPTELSSQLGAGNTAHANLPFSYTTSLPIIHTRISWKPYSQILFKLGGVPISTR